MAVGVRLREGEVHDVVIVFELHFEHKRIVVELSLFLGRRSLGWGITSFFVHAIDLHVRVFAISFLDPVFLVTVFCCGQNLLLSSLYFGLDKLQFFWADTHPLGVLTVLRLVHNTLVKLIPAIPRPTRDSRLGEVHQLQDVLAVFASVAHFEVEPLLMTARVRVNLHVQTVFGRRYSVGTQ